MKIAWLSNAPWAATGYGNQTKIFTPRLKDLGHEMLIIAFYGLQGGTLVLGDIPVFPKAVHAYGQDIAGPHALNNQADILLSLIDAWVYDANVLQRNGMRWVPWFPVDMEPLPPPVRRAVENAYRRIVFSRFGEKMVNDAGLDCYYVPHGIDTNLYKPIDRVQARQKMHLPTDKFIVGMVAANKGYPPRKAFYENIKAFAEFNKKHPDTLLYLHTQISDQDGTLQVNLLEYCQSVGLVPNENLRYAHPYQLWNGYPDEAMRDIYNSMDVHLLVSMGEGFGIPIVEAQACGTPVIVGDWTAMSELCFSGWKVDKKDARPAYTQLASYQFSPDPGAIADSLEMAYRMSGNEDYRKRARKGALAYDADKVTEKYWKPVLAEIEQDVKAWSDVDIPQNGMVEIANVAA